MPNYYICPPYRATSKHSQSPPHPQAIYIIGHTETAGATSGAHRTAHRAHAEVPHHLRTNYMLRIWRHTATTHDDVCAGNYLASARLRDHFNHPEHSHTHARVSAPKMDRCKWQVQFVARKNRAHTASVRIDRRYCQLSCWSRPCTAHHHACPEPDRCMEVFAGKKKCNRAPGLCSMLQRLYGICP